MDAQTEVRIIISSTDATLGMGGWLSLTQSGLSPDKKRQAYLGAQGRGGLAKKGYEVAQGIKICEHASIACKKSKHT